MAITHTFVSALPDDAADAAAGLVVSSNWNDSHAIDSIEIAGGTVTASTPLVDATQTWNNGAVTFTAQKVNITDTASASGSLLADWQVGGTSKASIGKDGSFTLPWFKVYGAGDSSYFGRSGVAWHLYIQQTANRVSFAANTTVSWTGAVGGADAVIDLSLVRDAASILAQRNSTNAQTFRVYGTYTDSSNYVRASLASSSTAVTLAAETAGTGTDNVPVNITPAGTEGVVIGNFAQLTEMTAPAAGAANTARLFCEDNGSGKTRLMVQFASGAAQQIAIEP